MTVERSNETKKKRKNMMERMELLCMDAWNDDEKGVLKLMETTCFENIIDIKKTGYAEEGFVDLKGSQKLSLVALEHMMRNNLSKTELNAILYMIEHQDMEGRTFINSTILQNGIKCSHASFRKVIKSLYEKGIIFLKRSKSLCV